MQEATNFVAGLSFSRHIPPGRSGQCPEPTMFVTISRYMAPDGRSDVDRIRHLLRNIGTFLERHGEPVVWLYFREVSKAKQDHFHLIIFVPTHLRLRFRDTVRRFLKVRPMGNWPKTAVNFRSISTYAGGLTGLRSYALKDGDDEVRQAFRVLDRHKRTGGAVRGKRLAVSVSIGPAARRRAGWGSSIIALDHIRQTTDSADALAA